MPLFALFMQHAARLGDTARAKGPFRHALHLAHLVNRNTPSGARKNIAAHYDLGNDFYAAWLDPTMSYSSALAIDEDGLEVARGLTNFGSQEALILALNQDKTPKELLGYKASDVIINQKNLILLEERHLNWDQPVDDVLQVDEVSLD